MLQAEARGAASSCLTLGVARALVRMSDPRGGSEILIVLSVDVTADVGYGVSPTLLTITRSCWATNAPLTLLPRGRVSLVIIVDYRPVKYRG